MADEDIADPAGRAQGLHARVTSLLRRVDADRAVLYLVLSRVLQIASFPITLVLVARFLTAEQQGFYYAFASIQALQTFVELGFVLVILNTASHEWSRLRLDERGVIIGEPAALSRLVSLGRLVFKWYAIAALVFAAGAFAFGWYFFSRETTVQWQQPLFFLILMSALLLWTLPFNALLEGCNQVEIINRLRVSQTVLENLALWGVLLLGGGLWAPVAAVSAKLLRDLYLIFVEYRNFFAVFYFAPTTSRISWRAEIWPMQWRLAAAGVVTYFATSMYTLVIFHYHGAGPAGRVGMTLQLINGLQLIAMAFVITKVPRYGMLIARADYAALDRLWLRNSVTSLVIAVFGALTILVGIHILNVLHVPFAQRLLSPLPTSLFLVGAVITQAVQCLVIYLRAHKREPILVLNIVMCLIGGALIWRLGIRFGASGAAVANLIQMVLTLVWISVLWRRYRTQWHAVAEPLSTGGSSGL